MLNLLSLQTKLMSRVMDPLRNKTDFDIDDFGLAGKTFVSTYPNMNCMDRSNRKIRFTNTDRVKSDQSDFGAENLKNQVQGETTD